MLAILLLCAVAWTTWSCRAPAKVTVVRQIPLLVRCRIGSPPTPVAEIKTSPCEGWGACYTLLHATRLAQYLDDLKRYAADAYDLCAERPELEPDAGVP